METNSTSSAAISAARGADPESEARQDYLRILTAAQSIRDDVDAHLRGGPAPAMPTFERWAATYRDLNARYDDTMLRELFCECIYMLDCRLDYLCNEEALFSSLRRRAGLTPAHDPRPAFLHRAVSLFHAMTLHGRAEAFTERMREELARGEKKPRGGAK